MRSSRNLGFVVVVVMVTGVTPVLSSCTSSGEEEQRARAEPPSDRETAVSRVPEPVLAPEDLAVGSAKYEVHEISSASYVGRERLSAEVTTLETESARIVEAMMRAAVHVHRTNRFPDAVAVRLWEVWPPPELSQEEFDRLETSEEIRAYMRIRRAQRFEVYALDGCGWSGDPKPDRVRCDGPIWSFAAAELPAWILRDSPRVLSDPTANGWALRVW